MKVLMPHYLIIGLVFLVLTSSCDIEKTRRETSQQQETTRKVTAKEILGNPKYQAISYGGYRKKTRDIQPTIDELKEDMKILHAMNIKLLRTYNVHLAQASNLLKAIEELKAENNSFEMYVMLGAWINCKNSFTSHPNHHSEDIESNTSEIKKVVELANQYPDIVKIIAVGNEAMVRWAESYYVQPNVILKWVNHLQEMKKSGKLSSDVWITSSDNFASWGGGDSIYHTNDLKKLIKAVDFVSLHTYPMHDTHYNPQFWGLFEHEQDLSELEKVTATMQRAMQYAALQYDSAANFIRHVDSTKVVHIGETGWASASNEFYGPEGSKATDEIKQGIYYKLMREWTNSAKISCFYFEAFDEQWKDAGNPGGSENHFGLFTIDGQAKYAIWDLVDQGLFDELSRDGNAITKTYKGLKDSLLINVLVPPVKEKITIDY